MNDIVSLKQMAEAKMGGVSKATIFMVAPETIEVEKGFNARPIDRDHLLSLVDSMRNGTIMPPVVVRVKDGRVLLVDGHHRRDAVIYGIQHGILSRDQKLGCVQYRGDEADCITLLLTSSQGLPLTPLQAGVQYQKLANDHSLTTANIAARVGRSVQHVADMRILAGAGDDVAALVNAGQVSAATAVKAVRKDKAGAAEKLRAEVDKAKAKGKTKATPKTMGRDPVAKNDDWRQAIDKERVDKERMAFEADAVAYGFAIMRSAGGEYADAITGHRWAGWLARSGA